MSGHIILTYVSQVTLRSSGTDILYGCHLLRCLYNILYFLWLHDEFFIILYNILKIAITQLISTFHGNIWEILTFYGRIWPRLILAFRAIARLILTFHDRIIAREYLTSLQQIVPDCIPKNHVTFKFWMNSEITT